MGLEIEEELRRRVSRLWALCCGFSQREAAYLTFWRWLARERGETGQRLKGADAPIAGRK
jgi:hypothetical protein